MKTHSSHTVLNPGSCGAGKPSPDLFISQNLASLRRLHRYSQEDVAEKIGVSRQAVAKWENGETTPDILNCAALARLYDVSVDNLIQYNPKAEKLPIPPSGKHLFGTVKVGERGQIVCQKKRGISSRSRLIRCNQKRKGKAQSRRNRRYSQEIFVS
ncbi:MAG: helix-turn-helix transcriptional regulator [Lachnospiraceae bacterium]|nr:helix-turn-helix transcriptional regulator [Lachnospiraceae bacterium]